MILFKNATILNDTFQFVKSDLLVENDKIKKIGTELTAVGAEEVNLNGKYLIPGIVDIHTHGSAGCDTSDGNYEDLAVMSKFQAQNGVTSYCPTTMTLAEDTLTKVFKNIAQYVKSDMQGAIVLGINMEGPYFNKAKKGAQNEAWLATPDIAQFRRLNKAAEGLIKLCDLAPELEGSEEFILELKDEVKLSIAHTNASYDIAKKAIELGVGHCTHLYNAMPAMSHRDPSVIGAIMDSDARAELICDGIHIHEAVVRNTFRTLTDDRICLISDSMRACGMPDGEYDLGGQNVTVHGTTATLKDGTLAGSATNLMGCVKKAIEFGIPIESAVKAATINPAKEIGEDKKIGSIKAGKQADLVIWDKDLNVEMVFIKGKKFK